MRRHLIILPVLLCMALLMTAVSAQVMTQSKSSGKLKDIVLTTADIKDSYKVIGIVSARGGEVDLDSLNGKLKDAARSLGADYVIGVNYFNYSGYVYAYGTAVKIKE